MLTRARKAIWNKHFNELDEYLRTHQALPPRKTILYMWFHAQLRNYKRNHGFMAEPELRATWECFQDDHGHLVAPHNLVYEIKAEQLRQYLTNHDEKPKRSTPLGKWCHVQQKKHYNKKMNSDNQQIWEDLQAEFPEQLTLSRFQKWHLILRNIIKHLEDNGGELTGDHMYTRWVNLQMHNYDRGLDEMASPKIRRAWVDKFLARVEIINNATAD